MKIDCHIHSLCSDGVYPVSKLISLLKKEQITGFSITDHDTVDGIKEARCLSEHHMEFVTGIEITCREMTSNPIKQSFSMHLLGYGFDENNAQLRTQLEIKKNKVIKMFDTLCDDITNLGYPIKRSESPISCGNVLQFCDVIEDVRSRYPNANHHVFALIDAFHPKLNDCNLPVETAIALIHQAKGKAVWAHPFCVYRNFKKIGLNRQEISMMISELKSIGLDGIETYYAAFGEEDQAWLHTLAQKENLMETAGSDFHGSKGRSQIGVDADITLFSNKDSQ